MKDLKIVDINHSEEAYDPDRVLEEAKGTFKDFILIGYDHDEVMQVRHSETMMRHEILWLLEIYKKHLINGTD